MNLPALSAWLAANYDLPRPITCQLLRTYTNDVYVVQSSGVQFVLKVYGQYWRSHDEIRYEAALLQHLAAKGMKVPSPVVGNGGRVVRRITTSDDGERQAVLFPWASGEKPQPPFAPELYFAFGEAVARMHALSTDFVSPYPRRPLDTTFLLDEPLQEIAPLLENTDARAFLTELVNRLRNQITAFAEDGLDWGPIHNDATMDNLHVTNNGQVILFDFDSGGPGWRAADLQGWTLLDPAAFAEKGEAFRSGYSRIRPLAPLEVQAAPVLTLAGEVWAMKVDLKNRLLAQGKEAVRAYLQTQLSGLQERERQWVLFAM